MPIDPSIALKAAPSSFDLGQTLQNALTIRGMQQTNQLNQMKLAQAQQAAEEENALRQATRGLDVSTPEGQQAYGQALLNRGNVAAYQKFQQGLYEQTEAQRKAQTAGIEYDKAKHDQVNQAIGDIAKYYSKDDALAGLEKSYSDGKIDELKYNSMKNFITAEPNWASAQKKLLMSLLSAKEQYETTKPDVQKVDIGGSIKFIDMNKDSATYGQEVKSLTKTATPGERATASRTGAEKPLTATQKAALKKSQVEDQTNINTLKSTADDLESLTDNLVGNATKGIAPDPGLKGITGAQALLPSAPKVTVGGVEITSGKARIAQQKLDTIKGKVMALGRQLATEHGKLGNMAVQEWKFISDAVQKIDPAADNFEDQLRDIVRQARDLESRARSRYEMQYEESSAPAADDKAQLAPQDQAALDWANKNPKDPRAAQIKAKLGVK